MTAPSDIEGPTRVDELSAAETAILGNDGQVRSILDNLYDGVYMTDASRRISYWNRGAEKITGFTAEEIIGKHCWDNLLQHVDEKGNSLCQGECALSKTICQGCPQEMEAFLYHKLGHRVPVRIRVNPVRDAYGAIVGAVEVFTDNFTSQRAQERIAALEQMAYLDSLTGIANRRFAEVSLTAALSELDRFGWPFGIVLMDIDRFKEINDRYGHAMGDRVLQTVAATLTASSRPFDVVSRWGGDEFLSIVKNITQNQLDGVMEKYENLVATSYCPTGDDLIRVSISAGATLAQPLDTPQMMVERADERMYRRKSRRSPRSREPKHDFGGR